MTEISLHESLRLEETLNQFCQRLEDSAKLLDKYNWYRLGLDAVLVGDPLAEQFREAALRLRVLHRDYRRANERVGECLEMTREIRDLVREE